VIASGEYYFDKDEADKVCRFFEHLPHIKGRMAGKPFRLEAWQRDEIVRPLFGWKRKADGTRRYRTAYIEVPRKNGKSTLCAGIALYLLFCDGEQGAEVYSVAGTREQALAVFDPAVAMIQETDLRKSCLVRKSQKRVIYKNSFYKALAAEADPAHGLNPHGIIFDELHVQPNRDLWDALQSGKGARTQPLTVAITTAGYDRSSICWEQHEYARRINDPNDPLEDDAFLGVIYGADPEEDWADVETWKKANPNYGVSIMPEFLREELAKAKDSPAYENTFRRLYLNQWTEQDVRWMPMEHWDACNEEPDELAGRECFAGLDISSTRDLTSLVLVFPDDDGGFDVLPFFWAPRDAATKRDKQDRQSYLGWAGTHITLTPGSAVDQSIIREKMWECSKRYDLRAVGFDPWNMDECYQQLLREGWPEEKLMKYPQNFATYNEPMKRTLELARERKLRHGGNPVLRWNASNVVAMEDSNGNLKPNKGKSGDKIDGFCAMLMGLGLALEMAGEKVITTSGIHILSGGGPEPEDDDDFD
jgi:phage terminase large subunit-like protein